MFKNTNYWDADEEEVLRQKIKQFRKNQAEQNKKRPAEACGNCGKDI
jgi:hypothetical protein